MTTPHGPRAVPPYGQEAAYATHPGAARADAVPPPPPPGAAGPAGTPAPGWGTPEPGAGPGDGGYPGGYGAAGPQGYPTPAYRPSLPRNDLGIWSFVLGLLGVLGCVFFTGVPAIVLGGSARRAVAAGEADNGGLATAGVVLGWVATAVGVLVLVSLVLLAALPLLFLGLVPYLP